MIVIIGTKYRYRELVENDDGVHYCHNCREYGDFRLVEARNWLTLFFIPVFPVGEKKVVSICNRCGN